MASTSFANNSDFFYDDGSVSGSINDRRSMDNSSELLGIVPNVSNVHFMDKSDMLVKISRAVFEDFHRNVSEGTSSFRDILQGFLETCDFAVKTIENCQKAGRKWIETLE
uniref:Uncharacterized protein n=1 Tax=Ditylenchus dipsaci TaxID=166011 RepID=A0A915ELM5_9BILA